MSRVLYHFAVTEAIEKFVDVSIAEAANCLQKAIDIYTDMGRFTIAAKHHQVKKLAQVSHHFIKN